MLTNSEELWDKGPGASGDQSWPMTTEEPSGEIVLYQHGDEPAIEVRLDGETVWVTQAQLVELFQSSKANISEHISNIMAEGEVDPAATVREFRTVRQEGSRQVTRTLTYYNLDVILSIGYRVKSTIATQFRIWATERLREYLVKGFTMDDAKLKNLGGGTYWHELLERIRDIRSSEKVLSTENQTRVAINRTPSAASRHTPSLIFSALGSDTKGTSRQATRYQADKASGATNTTARNHRNE